MYWHFFSIKLCSVTAYIHPLSLFSLIMMPVWLIIRFLEVYPPFFLTFLKYFLYIYNTGLISGRVLWLNFQIADFLFSFFYSSIETFYCFSLSSSLILTSNISNNFPFLRNAEWETLLKEKHSMGKDRHWWLRKHY